MPQTVGEIAWWAFNLCLLGLVGWAKSDLSEIKKDTKENRALQEKNALDIAKIEARCEERHRREP